MKIIVESITDKKLVSASERGLPFGILNYIYNQDYIYTDSLENVVEISYDKVMSIFNIRDRRALKRYIETLNNSGYINVISKINNIDRIQVNVLRDKFNFIKFEKSIFEALKEESRCMQLYAYYKLNNMQGTINIAYDIIYKDTGIHSTYIKCYNIVLEKMGALKIIKDSNENNINGYLTLDTVNNFDLVDKVDFKPSGKSNSEKLKYITYNCKEALIEKYMSENLELIESGLTLIGRQYSVQHGEIDILVKDKDNKVCVIEVKNDYCDKNICFQALYYPQEFQNETRMIVINSDYHIKILKALEQIKGLEIYKYKLKFKENTEEIIDFQLERIK